MKKYRLLLVFLIGIILLSLISCAGGLDKRKEAPGAARESVGLEEEYFAKQKDKAIALEEFVAEEKEALKKVELEPESEDAGEVPDVAIEAARKLATSESYRVRSPELLARIDSPDLEPLPFILSRQHCPYPHRTV